MEIKYIRQTSLINIKEFRDNKIMIVGCGAIGSFTAVSLAKMGLTKFVLYDDDKIEAHNLPNQFFMYDDIGKHKAYQTYLNMRKFNPEAVVLAESTKFKSNISFNCSIVVCCVDNMISRKSIFQDIVKSGCQLFIDTRMAGLQGQVYTVDMTNKKEIANYRKSLFNDKQAVQVRCTERSIIFTVMGIASLVCNQIVKALKSEKFSNYIVLDYSVPQMI